MAAAVPHAQQVVEGLVTQLNQRSEIVTLQRSVGLDVSDSQASAFVAHLSQMSVSLDGAARLTRQAKLGPWSSSQMANIAAAVNAAAERTDPSGGTRPPQTCDPLERYFTQQLHDYFKSDVIDVDIATRMVAVQLYKLGLVCPSNQVLKRATSIIQLAGLKVTTMGAGSQSNIGKNIRSYVKSLDKDKKFPLAHILVHPADPSALPAAHLQHAYGDSQPVPFVIEGLPCATASCAYRESKKGVKEQGSAVVPYGTSTEQMMATAVTSAIAPLAQVMQQAMGTIPGLQIFGAPKMVQRRAPQDLEQAVRDAAETAKLRKRRTTAEAAADGGKAAGAAAQTGAARKRPAAAVVKLCASDFRSEATCKATYHKGKNDWTSRAYGIAKRRCLSSGMGEDEAKDVAKEVYHVALKSYERVFGK
ncbi:unnamed protein product [Prorocentrum cordatum]|uniref:Uncharacterized protein n=1 Tax=Prorocentrum cordatum TaxID=2364126 RepID=A0ABN9RNH3_9DINO|nr:unnamed protein product [Polarella glacialis]